jgi:hypothetical protein
VSEKDTFGQEQKLNHEALQRAGEERLKELREQHERVETKSPERGIDDLQHEALAEAAKIERDKQEQERSQESSPVERRKGTTSRAERKAKLDASYNATMSEVRTQMSAPSRAFSKVIHNKVVEKASNAVGTTVARPNAILTGAVFAFVLTLGVYLLAKNLGYPLSGFETIGAFVLGWILGLCYDFLKVMITGRK